MHELIIWTSAKTLFPFVLYTRAGGRNDAWGGADGVTTYGAWPGGYDGGLTGKYAKQRNILMSTEVITSSLSINCFLFKEKLLTRRWWLESRLEIYNTQIHKLCNLNE